MQEHINSDAGFPTFEAGINAARAAKKGEILTDPNYDSHVKLTGSQSPAQERTEIAVHQEAHNTDLVSGIGLAGLSAAQEVSLQEVSGHDGMDQERVAKIRAGMVAANSSEHRQ